MISWHNREDRGHECSIIRTIVLQKGDGGGVRNTSFTA